MQYVMCMDCKEPICRYGYSGLEYSYSLFLCIDIRVSYLV